MNNHDDLIATARANQRASLDELAGKQLLADAGVRVPRTAMTLDAAGVDQALRGLSLPVVVKVVSPDILHKSDAGGVKVNLGTADQVRQAITAMAALPAIRAARLDGYLIEEMAPAGQEIVIGSVVDPQFGPMIMVGLGGIFVEVLADVSFRLCPITPLDASEMLDELKGAAILDGVRGGKPVSRAAIIDALLRIGGEGGLLERHAGEFSEIDINPLIVSESTAMAVDARFILAPRGADDTTPAVRVAPTTPDRDVLQEYASLFTPKTVAVIGASTKGGALPNVFIRRIRELGYDGDIYPIHPSAPEIDGLAAYRTLADTPKPVDYAFIAVSAAQIPDMLSVANGHVRFAQVISSGFGEVGEGVELQDRLAAAARAGGMRLLGPNCLGLFSPRGKITFGENSPRGVGTVGIVSQSGGLGTDIMRRGASRGLTFSGVITVGNCADVGPSDLLEFYLADPATKVIGFYIETAQDGQRLAATLRAAKAKKPVVMLKGGRTRQGLAAAASHTGSLAGDARAWTALSRQTGCVLVETLDQFIDTLLAFQTLTPHTRHPVQNIVLFGNGGGTSVLATDYFAQLGLEVNPFGAAALDALATLKLPPGTSITNPVDCPVITLQQDDGRVAEKILDEIYTKGRPDAVVMHLNLASFSGRTKPEVLDNLMLAALRVQDNYPGQAHFLLVLRSDGEAALDARKREFRDKAVALGIPVFDEMSNAGHALAAIAAHERFVFSRGFQADDPAGGATPKK